MKVTRQMLFGIALAIFAGTLWLYWPSIHGAFVSVDDNEYLEQAARYNGLTWQALKWAVTTKSPYYQVLPRLSHALDYQLWGKNATGHHATSVFLHALNVLIVFGFMWTLLGAVSVTAGERLAMTVLCAVVFAVHPLQVESVAWISGRTQLLCALFGISCLWAYAANTNRWTVWGLFTLALLSKPMAVSLPFVMVAMDYFPLQRHDRLNWRALLREKAVLVALAAVVSVATISTEANLGDTMPLAPRLWMVFPHLMFYPWRLLFPVHFAPFYSMHLTPAPGQWRVILSILSIGAITSLAVWSWRRVPALAAGWGAYLAFVLPVTGLIHGGTASPRHAYFAMLPLLPLAGGAVIWLWRRSGTVARSAIIGLVIVELCVYVVLTHGLILDWHNDETLRRAELAWFPDAEFANRALAIALLEQDRANEALPYAQRDVEIAPQICWSHKTLGDVLKKLGRLPDAVEEYKSELQLKSDIPEGHQNLGNLLYQMGRVPEAAEQYEQALQIKPDMAEAQNNLGLALFRMGKTKEAIERYQQALQLKPDDDSAHYNLGLALVRLGKFPEAAEHWEQVVRLKPDNALAYYNLGLCLEKMGKVRDGIAQYEKALLLKPDLTTAQNGLAWMLATHPPAEGGDSARAITLAQEVCEREGNRIPSYLDTLATAYAAAGRFDEAIATAQKALELARAAAQPQLVTKLEARLELYRAGHVYIESADVMNPPKP